MDYKETQKQHQISLLNNPLIFANGTEGYGEFRGKLYQHILKDGKKNLRPTIQDDVCNYFNNNRIQWWGGSITGNLLSSQISCLNHLFSIRKDKSLILKILQGIDPNFEDIFKIPNDQFSQEYISFEVVSNSDLLNEGKRTRGANCTSVDALIIAQKNKKRYLIPIEWKYTEQEKSDKSKNETRCNRYRNLIKESECFMSPDANQILFKEPYYELMRQTLWAKFVVAKESERWLGVSDYLHLNIVPNGNTAFRGRNGEFKHTWLSCLKNETKYMLIDPSELFEPIKSESRCKTLIDYLQTRYWKK